MLKIVRRLDPKDPDPCNDLPEKPKWMHQRTYDRLVERYEAYDEKWGREIKMGEGDHAPLWQTYPLGAGLGATRDLR